MGNHAMNAFHTGFGSDNGRYIGNMSPDSSLSQCAVIIGYIFTHRWCIDYHLYRSICNEIFYIGTALSQLIGPFYRNTGSLQQFKSLICRIDSKIIFGKFLCNGCNLGFVSITDRYKYGSFQRQCSSCRFFSLIKSFS